MKKHLYNTRFGKLRWFIERFGAQEIMLKPLRMVFAPIIIPRLRKGTFQFRGTELEYFFHPYNMTWATERCVEVPLGRYFTATAPPGNLLEVGNVLSHYGPVAHDILDKFERGERVINEDITTFQPRKRYELIISLSTFEHIGYDDETETSSSEKILQALSACRKLLRGNGKLVITVPLGYNPELNTLIAGGGLGTRSETFLRRVAYRDWRECSREQALACRYKVPYPYANAIMVAEFEPESS